MARYRAAPAGTIRRVPLDALTAVYDRRSALTHVVAPPVPEILDALADGPANTDALMLRLRERYEMPDADPAVLAGHLEELVRLGIVARE